MTATRAERATQELSVLRQHEGVALTQLLKQMRRSFNIGEEQSHGSTG
jgi:hypothetical protein